MIDWKIADVYVLAESSASLEQGVRIFRNPFLFVIAMLIFIACGASYAIIAERRGEDSRLAKFFFRAMFGVVFLCVFLVGFSQFALRLSSHASLSKLFDDSRQTVVISLDGIESHGVTLPRESVEELAATIDGSISVLAHHSAPETLYFIHFVEAGYVFRMSEDSAIDNEYWLHWISYPGFDKNYEISEVRHFHSDELTLWNKKHIDGAFPGTTTEK